MENDLIYLDNNATTPLDERVFDTMLPFFRNLFANANSTHSAGMFTNNKINDARQQVADLINSNPKDVIFTSGATESVNIALKGLALHPNNSKKHIVTVQTEHKAVLDTCKHLESLGFEIDYLPVNRDGLINLDDLKQIVRKDYTLVVCIMWVNNETGVIQPIKSICTIAHEANALFITDATQAVGKIETDIVNNEIDAMCFSPHKFYGPKGVGALYLNRKSSAKNILTLQHGGGHENGFRSGTLNVPAIIGFGSACELAVEKMRRNEMQIRELRDYLENKLLKISGTFLNGNKKQRLFNTINICFPNFDANIFIAKYKNIAVSNGSACTAALVEPSHVLTAMGLTSEESLGSLRISLGIKNTKAEIKELIEKIQFECKNGSSLL